MVRFYRHAPLKSRKNPPIGELYPVNLRWLTVNSWGVQLIALFVPPLWRSTESLFNGGGLTLEDPCVFYLDDHYEMIAKDLNGLTCGELHAGIHLLSRDGRAWQVAPQAKA